ncbi:MAG TPA: MFS transporter [Steroidobacteraceae bacterium]|nr:MFS transporter [Steroidobacteraceae bacterium]
MVAEVPAGVGSVAGAGAQTQGWPARRAAYYGLFVIILATALNFLDLQIFNMLAQTIKADFRLTDEQLGFLLGLAPILFYAFVGIPLAYLVDIFPRKYVLAGGIAIIGGITALGGLSQNFVQLFLSRMLVGAGASAHAPGSYSMLADYFPPERLPRAIGILQLGFISGNAGGVYLGGVLLTIVAAWPVTHWMGLTIYSWQWVLMMVGAPGLLIAALLLFAKEPLRRVVGGETQSVSWGAVLREIWARKAVYLPLFIGLAISATEFYGLGNWRPAFLTRTYGWQPMRIGQWLGIVITVSYLLGAFVGTVFTEWLAKRYKDAHVRAATILFFLTAPFEIIAPLMPTGELALLCAGVGGVCALASAVPQNAAIQRITPNQMRGRVTAIYLFMFIFFGGFGAQLIGSVTQRVFGADNDLWKSIVLTASILLPLAAVTISLGIRPYGREVAKLEQLEARGAT